jgi:hypothetical protein
MRQRAGYSLSDQRSEGILQERNIDPVKNKLAQYKRKCLNHVSGMEDVTCAKRLSDLMEDEDDQ